MNESVQNFESKFAKLFVRLGEICFVSKLVCDRDIARRFTRSVIKWRGVRDAEVGVALRL